MAAAVDPGQEQAGRRGRSQPPRLAVPRGGARDALVQVHPRRVPEDAGGPCRWRRRGSWSRSRPAAGAAAAPGRTARTPPRTGRPANCSGRGGDAEGQHAAAGVPRDQRGQLRLRDVARPADDERLAHAPAAARARAGSRPAGRRCRPGGRRRGPSRRSRSGRARWRGTASAGASPPGRRSRPGGPRPRAGRAAGGTRARAPPPRPWSAGRCRPARWARSRRPGGSFTSPCTPTVEVWTNRRTPARAAASSRRSVPPTLTSR